MLIPQFSLKQTLLIIFLCAVVLAIVVLAFQGFVLAQIFAWSIVGLCAIFAIHSVVFAFLKICSLPFLHAESPLRSLHIPAPEEFDEVAAVGPVGSSSETSTSAPFHTAANPAAECIGPN